MSLAALLPTKENPHGDRAVISAHNAAVRETLDWIESTLLETRAWDPVTRKRPLMKAPWMVAALFRHIASRNLDPQLHTHAVIANMTRDEDGRWKSVEPTPLHPNARLIGAYYRDRLARHLIAKGHSIMPAMVGRLPIFELAGYGRELREAFSTRRHEILAYVYGKGWDRGAKAMQAATLATRKQKAEPVRAQLQERRWVRTQELGLDTALTEARSGQSIVPPEGRSTLEIVRRCMRQLEERQSAQPQLSNLGSTWFGPRCIRRLQPESNGRNRVAPAANRGSRPASPHAGHNRCGVQSAASNAAPDVGTGGVPVAGLAAFSPSVPYADPVGDRRRRGQSQIALRALHDGSVEAADAGRESWCSPFHPPRPERLGRVGGAR